MDRSAQKGRREGKIRRLAIRVGHDEGFTLIESVAAMLILSVILLALASTLVSGYRALSSTRGQQQAVGVGAEQVEWARSVQYDALAMETTDATITSDPRMSSCTAPAGFTHAFDPDGGTSSFSCEPVVSSATGGLVTPHTKTVTIAGQDFTVNNYVTWVDVDGTGDVKDVKRFTTLVTWDIGGRTRAYNTSTIISSVQKGLPTATFALTPNYQVKNVVPGSGNLAVFAHTIQNIGVLDRYGLSAEVPEGRSWTVNFYTDLNGNGHFESSDPLMTDSDGDGYVDTGNLNTNATYKFLAVWAIGATDTLGTDVVGIVAHSAVDPKSTMDARDKIKVGDANLNLYLHNYPFPPSGDTTAVKALPMTEDEPPIATTLYKYAIDQVDGSKTPTGATTAGRWIKKGGDKGESNAQKMVNWVFQMPETTAFNGTATVTIWAANVVTDKCGDKIKLKASLRTKVDAETDDKIADLADKEIEIDPPDTDPCGTYYQFDIPVSLNNKTVIKDEWLELKVNSRTGADFQSIAYDTTTYPAMVSLPQVLS